LRYNGVTPSHLSASLTIAPAAASGPVK